MDHAQRVRRSIEADLYPAIGDQPIADLRARPLLAALRKVEDRGAHELRERVQQRASMVS